MHLRSIGTLEVSAIGLGCMNLTGGYGGAADDATAARLLNEALDLGCTFLDTATMYGAGKNESLIGRAIGHRRRDYVLASKCGLTADGTDGRPRTLAAQIDASLGRLKTDTIDLYYLHRADPDVPIEESVGALGRMVEAGKVREIGLSEVSTPMLHRAVAEHPVAAVQSEYSLWSRTPERGMLAACAALDVAFVPFSPLGRQFLTGRARDTDALDADDLRSTIARPRFEPAAFAANAKLLVPFGEVANRLGRTRSQLALAWLLAREGGELVPIPGTKHIEWLRENVGAADVALDEETVAELDALFDESRVTGTRYTAERMAASDAEQDGLHEDEEARERAAWEQARREARERRAGDAGRGRGGKVGG